MRMIQIKGVMTALQPLTYGPPGSMDKNNVHSIPTMGGDPYFSASGQKGAIRRATFAALNSLRNQIGGDTQVTLDDYYMNILGGIRQGTNKNKEGTEEEKSKADKEKKEKNDFINVGRLLEARKKNPMVSLFGAMDPLNIPGRLQVSHAFPIEDTNSKKITSRVNYCRTDELDRVSKDWDILDGDALEIYEAFRGVARDKSQAKKQSEDLRKQLKSKTLSDAERAVMEENKKAVDKQIKDSGAVAISQPFLNYEVFNPGTRFNVSFLLKDATDDELALFMSGLMQFGYDPKLGSHVAHGCGLVGMNLEVIEVNNGAKKRLGTVEIAGDYCGAVIDGEIKDLSIDLSKYDFKSKTYKDMLTTMNGGEND